VPDHTDVPGAPSEDRANGFDQRDGQGAVSSDQREVRGGLPLDDLTGAMAADAAAILQPGETMLVAAIITASDPGATGPVDVGHELGAFAFRLLTLGLLGENTQLMRLVLWGRAVDGAPGSAAHALHELIHGAAWPKLILTDRRVIVARGELLSPGKYQFSLVGSLPRASVVGAEPAPKGLLRRGRVVLHCADGSRVAVNILKKQSSIVVKTAGG
jgi:hypothetical protein